MAKKEDDYEEVDGIKYYPSYEEFLRAFKELTSEDSDEPNEEE